MKSKGMSVYQDTWAEALGWNIDVADDDDDDKQLPFETDETGSLSVDNMSDDENASDREALLKGLIGVGAELGTAEEMKQLKFKVSICWLVSVVTGVTQLI